MHFYGYLCVHMAVANIIPGVCVAGHSPCDSGPATHTHGVRMTVEDLRDKDPLLGQGGGTLHGGKDTGQQLGPQGARVAPGRLSARQDGIPGARARRRPRWASLGARTRH